MDELDIMNNKVVEKASKAMEFMAIKVQELHSQLENLRKEYSELKTQYDRQSKEIEELKRFNIKWK
jgi:prefoldin subunit 5